jgi:hypothetical protein
MNYNTCSFLTVAYLFQLAVKAWGEIITIVMEDDNASDAPERISMPFSINRPAVVMQEDPLCNKWKDCSRESMLRSLQEKNRTPEWYCAAAEKLALSVKAVGMVQRHSHWKVRMALVSSCYLLLSRCCRFGSFCHVLSRSSRFSGNVMSVGLTPP